MRDQSPQEPVLAIAVFYPCNSLMHQVSSWATRHPAYHLELSFAESVSEIRGLLHRTAITIVDATEEPVQAMAAFTQAMIVLESGRVAVYTETMHDGLELLVRVRGALLLFGPMGDGPWEELFAKMLQSVGWMRRLDLLTRGRTETDAGLPTAWLRKHRLQTSLTNRLLKFFSKKGGNKR